MSALGDLALRWVPAAEWVEVTDIDERHVHFALYGAGVTDRDVTWLESLLTYRLSPDGKIARVEVRVPDEPVEPYRGDPYSRSFPIDEWILEQITEIPLTLAHLAFKLPGGTGYKRERLQRALDRLAYREQVARHEDGRWFVVVPRP